MQNLLEICTEALDEIGLRAPSSITSTTNDLSRQLKAMANSTVLDILDRKKEGGWQKQRVEANFTTVGTELQFNIGTEFPHIQHIINQTFYNHTQQRRIYGPISVQEWRRLKADNYMPYSLFCYIRNNQLFITNPVAGETVYFSYVDKRGVFEGDGVTRKQRFTADTDLPIIDDHVVTLGVRWRFLAAKGLEYGEAFRAYEDRLGTISDDDVPAETLSINPHMNRADLFDDEVSSARGVNDDNAAIIWGDQTLDWS
jgi:hypothetical protein